MAVFARRSGLRASRRALLVSVARSLAQTIGVAVLVLPFAAAWGVGHAQIDDYLGANHARFASNYDGVIDLDLGPIGNAYLPSPRAPIGLTVTIGGVGAVDGDQASFFSEHTLAEYSALFAEPQEAVAGVIERLSDDIVVETLKAELVLLGVFAVFVLRRQLLAPWWHRTVSPRRAIAVYLTAVAVVFGSIAAPPPSAEGIRVPVDVDLGPSLRGLTVDSLLLADLIDRGIKGVELLTERQRKVVDTYVSNASAQLDAQEGSLPRPGPGETMMLGLSDLHCNEAMTELITRTVQLTHPAQILDSGDDTVNGTAVERFCITHEARITDGVPFLVASGNHDSDVTESQMRNAKVFTVLDGSVVESRGLSVLGDDDPEHNLPFSIERTMERPETEQQMGQRLLKTAQRKPVDVILFHQPAVAVEVMAAPDIPARLVVWGHFHLQAGPFVHKHADGSWTVGMQEGTAGGVREPTITEFSTPFSPPLISADVYFYFRDDATGLITGVQPVHFLPSAEVVVDHRIKTGDLATLPAETRLKLTGSATSPSPTPTPTPGPTPTPSPTPPPPVAGG